MAKRAHLIVCFLIFLSSCTDSSEEIKSEIPTDTNETDDTLSNMIDRSGYIEDVVLIDTCRIHWQSSFEQYNDLKTYTEGLRKQLHTQYKSLSGDERVYFIDSVGKIYGQLIAHEYLPHWQGTPWTFNGHTNQPKEGTVACSYLISTILKHSGININRYKLAQQAASNGSKTILGSPHAPKFIKNENIYSDLGQLSNGLYKVGMSNHTGFLLVENGAYYFMHSTFIEEEGVIIEHAQCSIAFNHSSIFQITPISANPFLIKKWLSGENIVVRTS